MKRLFVVTALLLAGLAMADRTITVTWLTTSVTTQQIQLNPLPDGGCVVQVWADVTLSDGGLVSPRLTSTKELSGASQTTCLSMLTAAKTLFKADQGL